MGRERYDRDEVLRATDLIALAESRSGQGRRAFDRWVGQCPNPAHPDHRPSFDIRKRDGVDLFACRSQCQTHGNAIDFLMWLDGLTFAQALENLAHRAGISPRSGPSMQPARRGVEPARPDRALPQDRATRVDGEAAERVLADFCLARGWSTETARRLGLYVVVGHGGAYAADRGRPRVRIPFLLGGEEGFAQDRATWDCASDERWRGPSGVSPLPFGVDVLDTLGDTFIDDRQLYLTEGATDAIAMLDAFPEAAVLGLPGGSWRRLIDLILEAVGNISGIELFCLTDSDPAGVTYRDQLHVAARPWRIPVHDIRPPDGLNDIADWRQRAGEDFAEQIIVACERAYACPFLLNEGHE